MHTVCWPEFYYFVLFYVLRCVKKHYVHLVLFRSWETYFINSSLANGLETEGWIWLLIKRVKASVFYQLILLTWWQWGEHRRDMTKVLEAPFLVPRSSLAWVLAQPQVPAIFKGMAPPLMSRRLPLGLPEPSYPPMLRSLRE